MVKKDIDEDARVRASQSRKCGRRMRSILPTWSFSAIFHGRDAQGGCLSSYFRTYCTLAFFSRSFIGEKDEVVHLRQCVRTQMTWSFSRDLSLVRRTRSCIFDSAYALK